MRSGIERGVGVLRSGLAEREPPPVTDMTLAGMNSHGQYVLLAESRHARSLWGDWAILVR